MADKTATPDILPNAPNIFGEAADYYKDLATPEAKASYRQRASEIDEQLNIDADNYLIKARKLEEEMKRATPDGEAIFTMTRDLIEQAMIMNDHRTELKMLQYITDGSGGSGFLRAEQLINGGDLFADFDIPRRLMVNNWFRDDVVKRILEEKLIKRREDADNAQRRDANEIVQIELGKVQGRARQIHGYVEKASLHERYNPDDAKRERAIVERLRGENTRDMQTVFEKYVLDGARAHGQTFVANQLNDIIAAGLVKRPPRPVQPVSQPAAASPAAPASQGAAETPASGSQPATGSTPAAQAGDSNNAAAVPDGVAAAATGSAPAASASNDGATATTTPLAPATAADVSRPAPEEEDSDQSSGSAPQIPPYNIILTQQLSQGGPKTVRDVLDAFGTAHSTTYDSDKAYPVLSSFVAKNYGLPMDKVVDLNDADTLKKLARAAAIYYAANGDLAAMQRVYEHPSNDDAETFAAQDMLIDAAVEIKKHGDAEQKKTDDTNPDAPPVIEAAPEKPDAFKYAEYAVLALAAAYGLKKLKDRLTQEGRIKAAQAQLDKENNNYDKALKRHIKKEDNVIRLEELAEKETDPAKKEQKLKAAQEARRKWNERGQELKDLRKELDDRQDEINRRIEDQEMTRADLEDRLEEARKKIVEAQKEVDEKQRALDKKKAKNPNKFYDKEEAELAEKREKLRKALEEQDRYEERMLKRRTEHDAAGNARSEELLERSEKLGQERARILEEQRKIKEEGKKLLQVYKDLDDERKELEKKKSKLGEEEYKRQLADIDSRWEENKKKVSALEEQARANRELETANKAAREQLNKDMDEYRRKWRAGKDIRNDVSENLGEDGPIARMKRFLRRNGVSEVEIERAVERATSPLGAEAETEIAREVKAETAAERKAVADLERALRAERAAAPAAEVATEAGRWINADGSPVEDGATRTEESQKALIENLQREVNETRAAVEGDEALIGRGEAELAAARENISKTDAQIARERSIRLIDGEWRIVGGPVNDDNEYRRADQHQAYTEELKRKIDSGNKALERSQQTLRQTEADLAAERTNFAKLETDFAGEKDRLLVDGDWRSPEGHKQYLNDLQQQIDASKGRIDGHEKTLETTRAGIVTQNEELARLNKDYARERSIKLVDGEWRFVSALEDFDKEYRVESIHQENLRTLESRQAAESQDIEQKARVLEETKARVASGRETLAAREKQLAYESSLKLVPGDKIADTSETGTKKPARAELEAKLAEARRALEEKQNALTQKKRAERAEKLALEAGARKEPTIGDVPKADDTGSESRREPTFDEKPPEDDGLTPQQKAIAEERKFLNERLKVIDPKAATLEEAFKNLDADIEALKAKREKNKGGNFKTEETDIARRQKALNELSLREQGLNGYEERSRKISVDRQVHEITLQRHNKEQAELDEDRKRLVEDKEKNPGDYSQREADIKKRTQDLLDESKILKQTEISLSERARVNEMRTPAHLIQERPNYTSRFNAAMGEARSVHINLREAGFVGNVSRVGGIAGTFMGLYSLSERFSEAGMADFRDDRTRSWAIGSTAMDVGATASMPAEMLLARQATNMQKVVAAGVGTEESLLGAAAKAGKFAKFARGAGVAGVVLGAGAGAMEYNTAAKALDAGRAARAVSGTVGGIGGGLGGATVGAWVGGALLGGACGFFSFGLGAIPCGTAGAAVGGVVGGFVGGWFGAKAADQAFSPALQKRFEDTMEINKMLQAAINEGLDSDFVNRIDGDHDGQLSVEEAKKALNQQGVTAMIYVDMNRDGKISAAELQDTINGRLVPTAQPMQTPPAPGAPAGHGSNGSLETTTAANIKDSGLDVAEVQSPFNSSAAIPGVNGTGTTLAGMGWRVNKPLV